MKRISTVKELQENAMRGGHNSNQLMRSTLEKYARIQDKIDGLRGEQKAVLSEGKEGGVLKTAVRKAYKIMAMSEEQLQAKEEIDEQTKEITDLFGGKLPSLSKAA